MAGGAINHNTAINGANQELFRLLTGQRDWRQVAEGDTSHRMSAALPELTNDDSWWPKQTWSTIASPTSVVHRRPTLPNQLLHSHLLYLTIACLVALVVGMPSIGGVRAQQQQPPPSSSLSSAAGMTFIRRESALYSNWSSSLAMSAASVDSVTDHQHQLPPVDAASSSSSDSSAEPIAAISGCSACRLRKQVEDLSLDSFKTHILQRLHINRPPNVSKPIISDEVLRRFYSDNGYRYIRLKPAATSFSVSSSDSGDKQLASDRMQGDEPMRPYRHAGVVEGASEAAGASQQQPQRRPHHSGRRVPANRHPEADTIIYEDESGEYQVDEDYYEPYPSGVGRRRRPKVPERVQRFNGGGGRNWRRQHQQDDFEDDDDGSDEEEDSSFDDDDEELQDLDDDEQEDEDERPFVEEFYSSTHSMFAFPKGE